MKPYVPIFSRTPARITEPAVGASTWASGNQVWNGNIGTLIANPTKNARNTQNWRPDGMKRRDLEQLGHVEGRRVAQARQGRSPSRPVEL